MPIRREGMNSLLTANQQTQIKKNLATFLAETD